MEFRKQASRFAQLLGISIYEFILPGWNARKEILSLILMKCICIQFF